MPTVVDTGEYDVKNHAGSSHPVMGWIGSSSTLRYIIDMKELIVSFLQSGKCSFEVIADAAPDFELPGMVFRKWEKAREKAMLLDFDVGIMPLTDDIWSRGKCGLKLIQYMASGLPSVTHPVGAANEIITDGTNGFLKKSPEEWLAAIRELAADPALRGKVGKAARRDRGRAIFPEQMGPEGRRNHGFPMKNLKTHTVNGTEWHLEDDGLLQVLGEVTGEGAVRRGYAVYPYKEGKVFVKAFREKGLAGFVRNRVLPRGKKEFMVGRQLLSFGISTPRPLGYGITPGGSYIIQEWIEAESFSSMVKEGGRGGSHGRACRRSSRPSKSFT